MTEMYGGTCYVLLAHADAQHVRRLTDALAPSPVLLHCDARTDDATYRAMIAGDNVRPIPRRVTPWASWDVAAAELHAMQNALDVPGWEHLVVLSGSDYPLHSIADIDAELSRYRGRSLTTSQPLPRPNWGRSGGIDRVRYRHWTYRKHMLRLHLPRRIPGGISLHGGAVSKILARDHVAAVVDLYQGRPELARFWRRTWASDEIFILTLLHTALAEQHRTDEIVYGSRWFIDWGAGGQKSPAWLSDRHLDDIIAAASGSPSALFGRKFGTAHSASLLDAVDRRLRAAEALS